MFLAAAMRGQAVSRCLIFAALLAVCSLSAVATELPARGSVEALFSPWDDVEGRLIDVIAASRHSIHVQAYLLTSRSIAKALLEAHQRGVQVRMLADAAMVGSSKTTQIPKLAAAGIPVWLEHRYANAHNKVLLLDVESAQAVVITGSYNYTWSAQARNAENILILRDNSALAAVYLKNWQRHQRDAVPYGEVKTNGK